jgi:hypothetical protein
MNKKDDTVMLNNFDAVIKLLNNSDVIKINLKKKNINLSFN